MYLITGHFEFITHKHLTILVVALSLQKAQKKKYMKKMFAIALFVATALTGFAQKKAEWKQMHEFHGVMGKTFHPAEEGNLQPLKDSAAVLLMRAKTWQASAVPEGYNATVVKPILKKLVTQCAGISKAVKAKKDDATLKTLITNAHDTFHEIMEKCRNEHH
jgi:hypothetical protein